MVIFEVNIFQELHLLMTYSLIYETNENIKEKILFKENNKIYNIKILNHEFKYQLPINFIFCRFEFNWFNPITGNIHYIDQPINTANFIFKVKSTKWLANYEVEIGNKIR